jgi:hypothetical protein
MNWSLLSDLPLSKGLRFATAAIFAASALVVGTGPVGCGDEGSGTTGRRIVLDVKIAASPESKSFTNARGWSITISKAAIATGAFYFYDGDTLFAARTPAHGSWFVKSAFAHPGHYVPGNAKGEMRSPGSADLLAGATLGHGDGVSGFARSATFMFSSPAAGVAAGELGPNVIVVEGTAAKAAETRSFRVEVGLDEVKDAKGVAQIEGCPFTPADMQGDGVVSITIKIPMWFDQVAFDEVPKGTDGAPVVLSAGLARNQFIRGTKGGLAYVFSYAPL